MLTPQEVSEKTFPKASGFSGGYQMAAVDGFLDSLTEDYTALFKDNMALKAKLKVLAEKVEEYRTTEESMRATLLTAQRMADKLVQDARAEKDTLLTRAQAEVATEIARLDSQRREAEQKLAMAQRSLGEFLQRSNELLTAQSSFLSTLPELQLLQSEEPTEEAVDSVTAEIIKTCALSEDDVAAEAETETVEVDETEAGLDDFSLSLDELKFGRNYTLGED